MSGKSSILTGPQFSLGDAPSSSNPSPPLSPRKRRGYSGTRILRSRKRTIYTVLIYTRPCLRNRLRLWREISSAGVRSVVSFIVYFHSYQLNENLKGRSLHARCRMDERVRITVSVELKRRYRLVRVPVVVGPSRDLLHNHMLTQDTSG